MGTYWGTAELAWRWVMDQVRYDDGWWIPEYPGGDLDLRLRDGMYAGIGGLAHVLAEIRLSREWTAREAELADAITARVQASIGTTSDVTFFNGLGSTVSVLTTLGAPGADAAVARLLELSTPDGWPQDFLDNAEKYLPGARAHDLAVGSAGVLLTAVWARRHGVEGAEELARVAADVLLAEREEAEIGANWRWVPQRFTTNDWHSPNFSHGVAGIAAAFALAGAEFARPDLVQAAVDGAEHLVSLGGTSDGGFLVKTRCPGIEDVRPFSYGWCHGPTGTSLLWPALRHAGVSEVAGVDVADWHRRCLHSIRVSGLPERKYPGFWDNDGRCCGTAGVGDVLLDSGQHTDFALHLADVVVERAVPDGAGVCWRFIEHRNDEPLLPPGIGWMQGAAGIAGFLFHAGRVEQGDLRSVPRMDTWWSLVA
ncbi:lanthionine synthetase LanC family protein [Lentzea sp. BCCO 10_0061]|uniref:Lanthionine synthetase LanC family protein n=1 Tax=Lentzea sokolovensis TaxID=3095429 RepID=A0ABU4URM8_9PSEU|nr:lanthionine synthetase LanC family protein [Lentzea sp. BCCO 10_0061]MDX8142163.1 lanthionine synthetase LanC family protein [Lentzea sp. BCCO 10_0061]